MSNTPAPAVTLASNNVAPPVATIAVAATATPSAPPAQNAGGVQVTTASTSGTLPAPRVRERYTNSTTSDVTWDSSTFGDGFVTQTVTAIGSGGRAPEAPRMGETIAALRAAKAAQVAALGQTAPAAPNIGAVQGQAQPAAVASTEPSVVYQLGLDADGNPTLVPLEGTAAVINGRSATIVKALPQLRQSQVAAAPPLVDNRPVFTMQGNRIVSAEPRQQQPGGGSGLFIEQQDSRFEPQQQYGAHYGGGAQPAAYNTGRVQYQLGNGTPVGSVGGVRYQGGSGVPTSNADATQLQPGRLYSSPVTSGADAAQLRPGRLYSSPVTSGADAAALRPGRLQSGGVTSNADAAQLQRGRR